MTTRDAAMSLYLNMNQNVRGKPNENYAREFMELFCLGPTGPDGSPNYSQDDVAGLAKAFTGWLLETNDTKPAYGTITFTPGRFELTAKTFLGTTIPAGQPQANARSARPRSTRASTRCSAHRNHAQFLIRKLWAEFIASPIPQATLDALVAGYRDSGYRLKPLIRAILMDPLIFESLGEPNLIKPPMVYLVGVLRAFGAPLRGTSMQGAMNNMQQRVYRPPNVAGWEGGLSWLNTNTVQGRWDLITRVQYLKYSNYYAGGGTAPHPVPPDVPGETPEAAFERAYALVGRPWLSDGHPREPAGVRGDAQRRQPERHRGRAAEPAPAAHLHPAGPDARRTRRTGDVTCAASSARRSSSPASATSAPGQTLPIPYQALDGFPAGTRARPAHPPAADAVGRRRVRVGLRRQGARLRAGLGVRRRRPPTPPPRRSASCCSTSRAATTGSTSCCPAAAPTTTTTRRVRANIKRLQGPNAGGRMGSLQLPGPGSALAFANPVVSGADNNGGAIGFDTLYGAGHRRRRLGPGDPARRRRQEVLAQPLRQQRPLVRGQRRPQQQDRLAGPLDRPQRLGRQPAAGGLDRHRALEGDPHGRPSPSARSTRCR